MPSIIRRFLSTAPPPVLALLLIVGGGLPARAGDLPQPECGGIVPCHCGDRVVADTVLTADIGPCDWESTPTPGELVGLRVDSDVTLDCAGHSILGPADAQRQEFGIRTGSESRPVSGLTIKNCHVSGFWWGIYVAYSEDVTVEDNVVTGNGWFSEVENGTGYGIDVANSTDVTLRRNQVVANGNEGIHLSTSTDVLVEDNHLADNGFEQLYVIESEFNTIRANRAFGGRQGLEMRDSDDNAFSYNEWRGSPKQWLENFNDRNVFLYDTFEGRLEIADASNSNRFELCSLFNPGGECAEIRSAYNVFFKSHFVCKKGLDTSRPLTLDRNVGLRRATSRREIALVLPGCSADMDGDGDVGVDDQAVVTLALGTAPGDLLWNPEADLDHDGRVDLIDVGAALAQVGNCRFANAAPRAVNKRITLVDAPAGQPDTIRIDAGRSSDDGDLIRYEFYAENVLTGSMLYRETFTGISPEQAHFDFTYPPGKYLVYVLVTDRFGVVSAPKRRLISVL